MRYALGITAAVVAGIAFNVGILIQKAAVGWAPKDQPRMRSLLKSPVRISGFIFQFILGTPLYTLSVGLVVLAVTMFGLTRLSIDVLAISMKEPGLLTRAVIFSGVLIAIAVGCAFIARRMAARALLMTGVVLLMGRPGAR